MNQYIAEALEGKQFEENPVIRKHGYKIEIFFTYDINGRLEEACTITSANGTKKNRQIKKLVSRKSVSSEFSSGGDEETFEEGKGSKNIKRYIKKVEAERPGITEGWLSMWMTKDMDSPSPTRATLNNFKDYRSEKYIWSENEDETSAGTRK